MSSSWCKIAVRYGFLFAFLQTLLVATVNESRAQYFGWEEDQITRWATSPTARPEDLKAIVSDPRFSAFSGNNRAVYWSGSHMSAAQKWAAANDKVTLEMTAGGKWLDQLRLFDTPEWEAFGGSRPVYKPGDVIDLFNSRPRMDTKMAAEIWDIFSKRYAERTSEETNVFSLGVSRLSAFTGGEKTWFRLEHPTLINNEQVTNIWQRDNFGNITGLVFGNSNGPGYTVANATAGFPIWRPANSLVRMGPSW